MKQYTRLKKDRSYAFIVGDEFKRAVYKGKHKSRLFDRYVYQFVDVDGNYFFEFATNIRLVWWG